MTLTGLQATFGLLFFNLLSLDLTAGSVLHSRPLRLGQGMCFQFHVYDLAYLLENILPKLRFLAMTQKEHTPP